MQIARGAVVALVLVAAATAPALGSAAVRTGLSGWFEYGNGFARNGFIGSGIPRAAIRQTWTARLDGRVTGQVLVVRNLPVRGAKTIYVVTSGGSVYAFDEHGGVRWRVKLGWFVHRCMQLDHYGVTGTPVVDRRTQALYIADAFGRLHALDLASGRERPGWPVTILPWFGHDHVWGALTLVGGSIYVPAGAYCDWPMEGKLVRVMIATREVRTWVPVPLSLGGGGGIWGWGGAAYSTRRRSLFVVTGNAFVGGSNTGAAFHEWAGYGEQLVELSPSLEVRAASHPMDITAPYDLDFTGSPVVIVPPGCAELVAALNKNGRLYVWRSDRVAEGPAASLPLQLAKPSRPLLTQAAYSPRLASLYVVTNVSLIRVGFEPDCRPRRVWARRLATRSLNGSPTVAGATVWLSTSGRRPRLLGVDARTGAVRSRLELGTLVLTAPTVIDEAVYVGSFFGRLYHFSPNK